MSTIKNLKELFKEFSDEQKCIDFLVQQRWDGSPVCPYCNSDKWYRIENGKRFKCGNKECYKKYSVTVGTIFQASNIPLTTWFPAIYLISSHKKGISSCQLARDLGITQKTAWFMLHRIRESLRDKECSFLKNTVEVDEVYLGGRMKNMSNKKRAALKENGYAYLPHKTMIIGMVERGGQLRLEPSPNIQKNNIPTIVYKNIDRTASLMTDGEGSYATIGRNYLAHDFVNHEANEYVRDGIIHTNTIEGAFGLLRRSIIGIYHKLSPKHLSRYCDEFQYRYNSKELKDGERFEVSLGYIEGRLSWKELTKDNGLPTKAVIQPKAIPINSKAGTRGKKNPVAQISNGEIIAVYPSIVEAEKATGIKQQNISKVVRGLRKTTSGYQWKYLDE